MHLVCCGKTPCGPLPSPRPAEAGETRSGTVRTRCVIVDDPGVKLNIPKDAFNWRNFGVARPVSGTFRPSEHAKTSAAQSIDGRSSLAPVLLGGVTARADGRAAPRRATHSDAKGRFSPASIRSESTFSEGGRGHTA